MIKDYISIILKGLEKEVLGYGFTYYEIDGGILFEMRGSSGGVLNKYIFYIISKQKNKDGHYINFGVTIPAVDNLTVKYIRKVLEVAVSNFMYKLINKEFRSVDPNGGDLGDGDLSGCQL